MIPATKKPFLFSPGNIKPPTYAFNLQKGLFYVRNAF